MPPLARYQQLVEEKLRETTIEELASRISKKMGISVPATKPSVAFAYYTYIYGQLAAL